MQAVILAAGMGKRLKELTKNNTKCMIKVNGVTLIERMLRQIDLKHFSRVIIVVGYEGEKLIRYISTLDISTPIHRDLLIMSNSRKTIWFFQSVLLIISLFLP